MIAPTLPTVAILRRHASGALIVTPATFIRAADLWREAASVDRLDERAAVYMERYGLLVRQRMDRTRQTQQARRRVQGSGR